MKLVTFQKIDESIHIGWLHKNGVVAMQKADKRLPNDMLAFIDDHETYFKIIREENLETISPHYQLSEVKLLAPLTNPRSFRDYVAFEEHMLNASKSFGHTVSPEWYNIPIFYFTNHQAIYGPNDEIKRPEKETKFDIELELAVIIGKKGNDIQGENANDYIFGYTIFNDWTARAIQRQEMTVPSWTTQRERFCQCDRAVYSD